MGLFLFLFEVKEGICWVGFVDIWVEGGVLGI